MLMVEPSNDQVETEVLGHAGQICAGIARENLPVDRLFIGVAVQSCRDALATRRLAWHQRTARHEHVGAQMDGITRCAGDERRNLPDTDVRRHRHLLLPEGGGQRRFICDGHEPVAEERRWHVFHQRHRTRQIGHRVAPGAMSPVVGRVDVALIDCATRDRQRAADGEPSLDNGCVTHGVSPGSWPRAR
ncbi:hypothetical protein QFZ97_006658 [Paraburkholderia youngii]